MCLRLLTVLILASCLVKGRSQNHLPDFTAIDRYVANIAYLEVPVDSLAKVLTLSSQNDFERLRAIYQYVIHHIAYDDEAYSNGRRRVNRSNKDILQRQKAVCWGYAQLITELCRHVDLSCHTITGYAKESPLPSRPFEKANHAWNAVKLNNNWFLLDATWGRSMLQGDNPFSLKYDLDFFLSDPALFIKSHFPLMPMWQLLECPVSYEDFIASHSTKDSKNCFFSFGDSIEIFEQLDYLDQQLKIMTIAYELNRSKTNRSQIGHALIDIAIAKKEEGDHRMQQDSLYLAQEILNAASSIFSLANHYCTFYAWQQEAQLYTQINLAQVSYQLIGESAENVDAVRSQFEAANDLLTKVHLPPIQKDSIRSLLKNYLSILDKWAQEKANPK